MCAPNTPWSGYAERFHYHYPVICFHDGDLRRGDAQAQVAQEGGVHHPPVRGCCRLHPGLPQRGGAWKRLVLPRWNDPRVVHRLRHLLRRLLALSDQVDWPTAPLGLRFEQGRRVFLYIKLLILLVITSKQTIISLPLNSRLLVLDLTKKWANSCCSSIRL